MEPAARTPIAEHLVALGGYLTLSLVLWGHVWFGGSVAHSITCNCGDTMQQVWWFEWLPWALLHGHNPLLTTTIWARFGGVNALTNTSWLAPGLALSPITVAFGPVASFNVANLLAPVCDGWAAFVLAGRLTRCFGARLLAGALFAFSPYVMRNVVLGHIDLTLVAYLPLVMGLGLALLSREARPVRIGLWLGVLSVVQFFTGLEVLAISLLTCLFCAFGVLVWRPRLLRAARRSLLVAGAVAVPIVAVALAYPLWFYLAGPRHVVGPFWPVSSSQLSRIVVAGPNVFSVHTALTAVGYLGPQGPNTDFLGVGVLLAAAVAVPLWRQRRAVLLALVGSALWALESVPPHLWARLAFLSSIDPVRFALPVSLCAGLLLGLSLALWWRALGRWSRTSSHPVRRRGARTVLVAAFAGALVPLLATYSVPFTVTSATVPTWFARDATRLAPGTAVLTVPFAYGLSALPMAWQAESGDSFDLIGGWAFVPGGNGVNDEVMSPLSGAVAALRALSRDPAAVTGAQQETIRAALERWRPVAVVVLADEAKPASERVVADTLGIDPTWSDGVWLWQLDRSTHLGPLRSAAPRRA